jgi:hypothetical protein
LSSSSAVETQTTRSVQRRQESVTIGERAYPGSGG